MTGDIVDSDEAGSDAVSELTGVLIESDQIIVDPLTVVVIKSN